MKMKSDSPKSGGNVPPIFKSGLDILQSDSSGYRFLVAGLIPAGTITILAGSSDTGKSILARQIAVAVALGRTQVAGFELNTKCKSVLYISTEDGIMDWKDKLQKYSLSDEEKSLLVNLKVVFDHEQIRIPVLKRLLEHEPVDLVVVDVFGDTFSGDLNSAIDVRKCFKDYKKLAEQFECTFVFLHHLNKQGERNNNPSKLHVQGSGAIEQAARCVLDLAKDVTGSDFRKLTITKSNYLPVSDKDKPYQLRLLPDLTFEYTGTRHNGTGSRILGTDPEIISKVLQLHQKNLTYRAIADLLSSEGLSIGKTKVGEIVRDYGQKNDESEGGELSVT